MPFSTKAFFILLMSTFFWKKSAFFGQNISFIQSNSVRKIVCRCILVLFSVFVIYNVTVNENISFMSYAFGIRNPASGLLQI